MGDFVQRLFTLPIVVDLIASGITVVGVWWQFFKPEDGLIVGTILGAAAIPLNAMVPAAHAIIGDTFLGVPINYKEKAPTTIREWKRDADEFGNIVGSKINGLFG